MQNGDDLEGHRGASQGVIAVQKPGSNNIYYVFTTGFVQGSTYQVGLYYSVVDMNLDGGLGAVTEEKNVLMVEAWDAIDKILAVKHENREDIWIITRKFNEDGYASFLLTENGIKTQAVISECLDKDLFQIQGNLKVSHDKKQLVAAYFEDGTETQFPIFEICTFNAWTGEISVLYTLQFFAEFNLAQEPWGV